MIDSVRNIAEFTAENMAIADHNFHPTFGDLAKVGVGGYLGQMLPEANNGLGIHLSDRLCLQLR